MTCAANVVVMYLPRILIQQRNIQSLLAASSNALQSIHHEL